MTHTLKVLNNGLRFLHQPCADSGVMHLCVAINTGSRDEPENQAGIAHFIEHMLFKGTAKRNTYQILNRLEGVGAELNAYTTKEQTFLHTSFLNVHLERALELLCDILFNATYPEAEIVKEKGVVLDEIESYLDAPEEAIFDDFDALLFPLHPLGNNILGSAESINALSREDVTAFVRSNYATDETVFGLYGDVPEKTLNRLIDKYLSKIPVKNGKTKRKPSLLYRPDTLTTSKNYIQAHCVVGGLSYTLSDDKKVGMMLLNSILGGSNMSSRLNLEIRERFGACYNIESSYIPMSDTGMFAVYFGTDAEKYDRCLKLVYKELNKLCQTKLGTGQLHQAKQRFNGQVAIAEEARMSVLLAMTKNIIDYGFVIHLHDIFKKIDAITSEQLLEIANEMFSPVKLSILTFIPES